MHKHANEVLNTETLWNSESELKCAAVPLVVTQAYVITNYSLSALETRSPSGQPYQESGWCVHHLRCQGDRGIGVGGSWSL